jgi:hypothetical protein
MDYLDNDKIFIFILLFLPGFLSVKVYSLIVADEKYDFSKNLLEIVGYGLLNFSLFSPLIFANFKYDWLNEMPFLYFSLILITLFIAPCCWPFLFNFLSNKTKLKSIFLNQY